MQATRSGPVGWIVETALPKDPGAAMFICGLALLALETIGPHSTCLGVSSSSKLVSTSKGLNVPLARAPGAY